MAKENFLYCLWHTVTFDLSSTIISIYFGIVVVAVAAVFVGVFCVLKD